MSTEKNLPEKKPVQKKPEHAKKEDSKSPAKTNKPPVKTADEEWENARENWASQQLQKAHAHLLAQFDTDDDLPLAKHLLLIAITGFFVIFFIWANMATLDEVARGEGKIIPSSEVQALQTLDAGIIEEFLAKEGDTVKAGQVLLRLSDIEASSDLGANNARYLGLLAAITRLQAESEGKKSIDFPEEVMKGAPTNVTEEINTFRTNQTQLQGQLTIFQQQMSQREQEVRELSQRVSDTRGIIALQREEMDMVRPLVEKGSAPKLELLQLERTIKEKSTELNSLLANLPRAQAAVNEAKARIADLTSSAQAQAQTELSAKLIEMNEIKERLGALTDRKTRTEIKSPVNGTIQEMKVKTIGGVVRPGEDIIKIVPKDDQLIVEAKIKPSDRAFIYPKQKAVIKLTAYDFSVYGGLPGEVLDISADTIEDQKGNFFYRVRLRTYETELKRKGEVLPIIPGMVATADILTGQKTVMQYLLKPFIKTLKDSFHER